MPRQDLRTRRESLGLTLREVSRRTGWSETSRQGINPGRLSIIERGVTPTLAEHTDEAKRHGKSGDNIADGFRISGLGQLIEAGIQSDRLVVFGD